jgi:hypothetical protein
MNSLQFPFSAKLREHFPKCMPPQLLNMLKNVFPLDYQMVNTSEKNNFQLNSTFDQELVEGLRQKGVDQVVLKIPDKNRTKYSSDAEFKLQEVGKIVVEIEKADHQKILYDLLKAHVYLREGADYVVLLIPTTRGRKPAENNMFEIGKRRLEDCIQVGMISEKAASQVFLVGFEQQYQEEGFNDTHRKEIQKQCRAYWAARSPI